MLCLTCKKLKAVVESSCPNCIFLSEEEEKFFPGLIDNLFQEEPEAAGYDREHQIFILMRVLPYTNPYKILWEEEIENHLINSIERSYEHVIIEYD